MNHPNKETAPDGSGVTSTGGDRSTHHPYLKAGTHIMSDTTDADQARNAYPVDSTGVTMGAGIPAADLDALIDKTHQTGDYSLLAPVPIPDGLTAGPWRLDDGRPIRTLSDGTTQWIDGSIQPKSHDDPVDLYPPKPGYWVIDKQRSDEAVREGRHRGAVRTISAAVLVSETRGEIVATAFQYPTEGHKEFWIVDIETPGLKAAGHRPLELDLAGGFVVHSEGQARDWLQLFGSLAIAANKGRRAELRAPKPPACDTSRPW